MNGLTIGTPKDLPFAMLARRHRLLAGKDAPMKPADNAVHIDTTKLTPDECFAQAVEIVEKRR